MQQIAGPYYIYFATIKPKPVKANESLNMKLFIRLAHIFRVVQSQIISCIWQRAYLNRMTIDNWHRRRITDVLGKVLLFGVGASVAEDKRRKRLLFTLFTCTLPNRFSSPPFHLRHLLLLLLLSLWLACRYYNLGHNQQYCIGGGGPLVQG